MGENKKAGPIEVKEVMPKRLCRGKPIEVVNHKPKEEK